MTGYRPHEAYFTEEQVKSFLAAARETLQETAEDVRRRIAAGTSPEHVLMQEIADHARTFAAVSQVSEDAAFLGLFSLVATAQIMLSERADAVQSALDAQPETKARIDAFIEDPPTGFTRDRDARPAR